MIDLLKKYLSKEELPEEDVERVSQALLAAKEDYALKEKWKNTLASQNTAPATGGKLVWLALVFLLATVIAGVYWYTKAEEAIPPVQYAMNYIESSPYPINQSRGNSEKEISLIKAAEAYQNKDYKKAISLYEDLNSKDPLQEKEQFYLALSLLNNGDVQKSLQNFLAIEKTQTASFPFATELKFFLGLNYTLLEQNEKALQYLKPLQTNNWERETINHLIEKLEEK